MNANDNGSTIHIPEEKKEIENKALEEIKIEELSPVTVNRILVSQPIRDDHDTLEMYCELPRTLHERFLRIKTIVKESISAHKTFMVYGRARVIRECMLKRKWCEKFYRKNISDQYLNPDSNALTLLSGLGDLMDHQGERLLVSKMLTNHTVDFLWNTGSDWPGWPSQENKTTLFNRYTRAAFTSKVGLCANVRQMLWYYEAGVANILFPRCYNLCHNDQMHAFAEDFRMTACLSLLKWLVNKIDSEGQDSVKSNVGTVPWKALDFAIERCKDYVSAQIHEDIDQEAEKIWPHQWDQFINWYYAIVQGQTVFANNQILIEDYFLASKHVLEKMRLYWPQIDMDGIMNVWIVKPGNKSRGRGIVLMNKFEEVVAKVNPTNKSDNRFVVQKYIEKPLLVYNTKFDIRQWFIVTCAQPLTFWMYKESYLRFCSQKFSLGDFDESIHLCNHAVQCKYKNCLDRDPTLPVDNMWDNTRFKEYLKTQGHDNAWDELIYPGMREGLVGCLLTSQDAMDRRKNSFELYGADFMIMEDFSVWLIEINSHPDMSYSSKVTTRLCRQVMEDTIKVVIDYRENKNASTGEFELAYRQKIPHCQPYLGTALSIHGTRIPAIEKKSNMNLLECKSNLTIKSPKAFLEETKSRIRNNIGPVIIDLIEELGIQLNEEFQSRYSITSPEGVLALPSTVPAKNSTTDNKKENNSVGTMTLIVKTKSPSSNRNNQGKRPTTTKTTPKKSSRKIRATSGPSNVSKPGTSDESSSKPSLISKIMALQQQAANASSSLQINSKRDDEKIITTAIRNAAKKYKRSSTTPENPAPGRSLLLPRNKILLEMSMENKKSKNHPKRHGTLTKQKNILTNVNDMYAVGMSFAK